jgi:hypothetical protein
LITVRVSGNAVHVTGLDPLKLNDLYADAPEPAPPSFHGMRPVSANLMYLLEKLPDAVWDDPEGKMMEARAGRFIQRLERPEPGDYERNFPFAPADDTLDFQLRVFAAARHMPVFALAPVAPGTGKSKMLINLACDKFMRNEIDCVAVVSAPKGVHRQWVNKMIPKHMSPGVWHQADYWRSTKKSYDVMGPSVRRSYLRWLTFNVEAFSAGGGRKKDLLKGRAAQDLLKFMKSGRCLLVIDEASRIKTPQATRTKVLTALAPCATQRATLTGTPITKGLEDLYAQYNFLDPNILGLSSFNAFKNRYCVMAPAYRGAGLGVEKVAGYRNVEEFVRKIAGVTFVVPKDVLGLPPKTYEELPVALTPEQKKLYREISKKLVDDLKTGGWQSWLNPATRFLRLQQLLSGRAYKASDDVEEPPTRVLVPSNRIKTLTEYLDDNAQPTIVWCRFTDDILEIEAALKAAGHTPVTFYGAQTDDEQDYAKQEFEAGRATEFISNPAAAGMGVDGLQGAAQRSVFYSHGSNREQRWQAEDRVHRMGMCGTALNVDMVAGPPQTVDRLVLESYKTTASLIEMVTRRPELLVTGNEGDDE